MTGMISDGCVAELVGPAEAADTPVRKFLGSNRAAGRLRPLMRKSQRILALLVPLLPTAASADEDEAPPLSIYGSARLDILADDSRMSNIEAPLFVEAEPRDDRIGELTMTPRLSQVGLGIDEWQFDGRGAYLGEGKLEVNFGGGAGTNVIRLRHAYATVTVKHRFEILAGQTWDLI